VARSPVVLLATEGTYPYALGGVSTWCDTLVRELPDVSFYVLAIVMNPYVLQRFQVPPNVRQVLAVPLWGMQDPSGHRNDLPFSEIFLHKRRTKPEAVERVFLPIWEQLLAALEVEDGYQMGECLGALYRTFHLYDYMETMKSWSVWMRFREWLQAGARAGRWPEPSVFEAAQALGWLYHFFIVLNTTLPEVDVVHSSAAAFCGVSGIVAKIQHGTRYLLTEHGVYLREQYLAVGRSNMSSFSKQFLVFLVRSVVKANLAWADEIAPVCRFNERWERLLGAQARKIHVIYNGVSPTRFKPVGQTPPSASDRFEILAVARSDPNKDIETLIRAVDLVRHHVPSVHCAIRGAVSVPEYHERMLALVRDLGLEGTIEFFGHTDDIAAAYQEADAVVQSSVTEAFPYAVLEAMMSGLPVVATDVGGTSEAIGEAGLLVPSRDPARLALALLMLAHDAGLRQRLGAAAYARARLLFDIGNNIRNFRGAYRRLAGLAEREGAVAERQALVLARALALARAGYGRLAVEQFREALALDPGSVAAAPILVQWAQAEQNLGETGASARHLIAAWLLARHRSSQEREAS
jgi:glycosyltransferase involved in cell wall biosynthesis